MLSTENKKNGGKSDNAIFDIFILHKIHFLLAQLLYKCFFSGRSGFVNRGTYDQTNITFVLIDKS